ncbi:MAG: HAD-IA family hydrolase [Alistipes sp.]|nr:HAD-IA family hydrolase [Alistipes sp.]
MNKDCVIGLITDGYKDTQLNKIQALNLMRYMKRDNIIISEEFGSEKPNPSNYIYFMNKYPDQEYIYVGDNIQKDFLAANELQWTTICLLDDGQNIHKQEFDKFNNQFQPQIKIENILQVLNYI